MCGQCEVTLSAWQTLRVYVHDRGSVDSRLLAEELTLILERALALSTPTPGPGPNRTRIALFRNPFQAIKALTPYMGSLGGAPGPGWPQPNFLVPWSLQSMQKCM